MLDQAGYYARSSCANDTSIPLRATPANHWWVNEFWEG